MPGTTQRPIEPQIQALQEQIDIVSSELAQTYEELVLLHKLGTNMRLTEPTGNFLQMACDSLTDIISLEGIAILLRQTVAEETKMTLTAGSGLIDIDEPLALMIHTRLLKELADGKEALLDSEVDSPFRYEWPASIRNIIAVPLWGKDHGGDNVAGPVKTSSIMGMMLGFNRLDKSDFDSTDVKLFYSVAGGCAVFAQNGRLFADLKELLVGSLKALTSSIDARDTYTLGHSERVALISRWIAEKLEKAGLLEPRQVHKTYLAGLLHDIGKVSIDSAVLKKGGQLTKKELGRIRVHPTIGAEILGEIKQMRDIIPAVLCHHEQADGRGYPNGWHGEQIPLVARIVGLADSFDAMTSKRTYRDALSLEDAIKEIRSGLGGQFDAEVGRIFLESNVQELWDMIQKTFTKTYRASSFSRYGTAAVEAILG